MKQEDFKKYEAERMKTEMTRRMNSLTKFEKKLVAIEKFVDDGHKIAFIEDLIRNRAFAKRVIKRTIQVVANFWFMFPRDCLDVHEIGRRTLEDIYDD